MKRGGKQKYDATVFLVQCQIRAGGGMILSRAEEQFRPLLIVGLEAGIIAEHLLNNRLQMRASRATESIVTQTKQTKIGLCEQVRVN